ncbi:hypothetical protein KC851_01955 [Candidatus Kaiserbacteria bacterium]|nr:hypothetical protein [Candidatus Kaiserbacteria bacterium]
MSTESFKPAADKEQIIAQMGGIDKIREAKDNALMTRTDAVLEYEELRKRKTHEASALSESELQAIEHRMNILWGKIDECKQLEAYYETVLPDDNSSNSTLE